MWYVEPSESRKGVFTVITVSGYPVTVDSIAASSPESIEKSISERMAASNAVYEYDSKPQLKFELTVRVSIIAAAKALQKSKLGFCAAPNKCNKEFWTLKRRRDLEKPGFKLKKDVDASDAVADIFNNGSMYAVDCAVALGIVYYKAVLDSLGQETFDALFQRIYLTYWNWGSVEKDLKLTWQKESDYFPGDRRYFSNPDVSPMNPVWKGENVIDLGNDLYYGHPLGIKKGEDIIKGLNSLRKPGAQRSAYLEDKANRPDFKYLFTHTPH
jgi:protein-glutamine gamma-glutamyltransferase